MGRQNEGEKSRVYKAVKRNIVKLPAYLAGNIVIVARRLIQKITSSLFNAENTAPGTTDTGSGNLQSDVQSSREQRPDIRQAMNDMSHTLDVLNQVHKPSGMIPHVSGPEMEAFLATVGPTWIPRGSSAADQPDYYTPSTIPGIGAVALALSADNPNLGRDEKLTPEFVGWMKLRNRRWPGIEVPKKHEMIVETWYMFLIDGERVWVDMLLAIDPKTGKARDLRRLKQINAPKRDRYDGGVQYQFCRKRMPSGNYIDAEREKRWLYWAINMWFQRDVGWQVQMQKGRRVLTFGIPNNEARRWFRRRLTVTTPSGGRRKILHEVTSHYRRTAKGQTTVKPHLRGERDFWWNGCRTRINTSPEDMRLISRFRGELDLADENQTDSGYSPYELGKKLRGEQPRTAK